jgi:hypothetical protein
MNGENEYVPADQAIELLGEKPEKFYYHSGRGEIRTETPPQPGKGKKNNRYLVSDILALRRRLIAQRQKKRPEPVIDWMYTKDLAAGVKLAQALYDDGVDLAELVVYQSWRKNNEHLTLAAFSQDRSEAYASIQVVPLPEQVILDVLSGKRTENSIQPDEIRSYNEPGEYTLLGTSAIVLKSRPELLLKLLRRYMEFWIEMFPDRYISRIYAQAVSNDGDRLTSSLFMAPRYDFTGPYPSYMLDLARPGRSKLINWFQEQLKAKAPLPPDLHWPPAVQALAQVTPTQTTTPVRAAVSSLKAAPAPTVKSDRGTLPDGMTNFTHFYRQHKISDATAGRGRIAGKYQATQGKWRDSEGHAITWALNEQQQRDFCHYFKRLSPDAKLIECDDPMCVCHSV